MAKLKAKAKRTKNRPEENGKFDNDTAAWSWIENLSDPINRKDILDEQVKTAYRLHFPNHRCVDEKILYCKKNCKQNPKCLAQLGVEKWIKPSNEPNPEENGSSIDSEDDDGTINKSRFCE